MGSAVALGAGYKFAVLALPDVRAEKAYGPIVSTNYGLAVTSALPDGALETWLEYIGRFHRDELAETSLFMWATAASTAPEVLDHENEDLKHQVYRFYLGLLIAVPYLSHGRVTSVTGANPGDVARVRSLTTYNRTFYTLGSPFPIISASHIALAARLAGAIKSHDDKYGHSRFTWFLRTFREACEAWPLEQRLHQFVRCAEGVVVPPMGQSGRHFAARLKRVCFGRATRELKELYTIRGGVEHLHGPYDRFPPLSKRGRWSRLLLRTVQAEALARYLIRSYLEQPALWPTFTDRASIDGFWAKGPASFKKLWPTRIDFASVAKSFNEEELDSRSPED